LEIQLVAKRPLLYCYLLRRFWENLLVESADCSTPKEDHRAGWKKPAPQNNDLPFVAVILEFSLTSPGRAR